jgi:tRNA modification GTPase
MRERDTVVALITSPLSAIRMALRISGEEVPELWPMFCEEAWPGNYGSSEKYIRLGDLSLPCKMFCMPEGRSYTREHSMEIHFPANEEISRRILEQCFSYGVRPAEPGEFTRRAFLNGRIQLNQAQSISALIAATDQKQRREAVQMLSSGQGDQLKDLKESIFNFRRNLEAVIDFPEEPDVEKQDWRWASDCDDLERQLATWQAQSQRQMDGPVALKILVLGPANAGKSSLVSSLIPNSMPVVSHVPGTTLDLVPYGVELEGERLQIYDSPGLKDIETEWDALSLGKLNDRLSAFDGYLLCQAVGDDQTLVWPDLPQHSKKCRVITKADQLQIKNMARDEFTQAQHIREFVLISSMTGEGLPKLKDILVEWSRELAHQKISPFAALRQRLLTLARQRLIICRELLLSEYPNEELAAYELDELLDEINGLTGEEGGNEALLDGIFRDFCIGK